MSDVAVSPAKRLASSAAASAARNSPAAPDVPAITGDILTDTSLQTLPVRNPGPLVSTFPQGIRHGGGGDPDTGRFSELHDRVHRCLTAC
jgi:hypothetical protein